MYKKFLFSFLLVTLLFSSHCFAKTIVVFGDSLSAGYGLNSSQTWVKLLAQQLHQSHYQVINDSISGDTTGNGLARFPQMLKKYQPDIVIIALGGNDGLRGLPLSMMQQNLTEMIKLAQANRAKVLLAAVRLPPNYGPVYTRQFEAVFKQLAEQYQVAFIPKLLDKVAEKRQLMQQDNFHPNDKAQVIIFNTVWKTLHTLL